MALTNAERQAIYKARRTETIDTLAQQNTALVEEVAELRAEVERLKAKAHRLELAALKAQLAEAKRPAAPPPQTKTEQKSATASEPAKRPGKRAL